MRVLVTGSAGFIGYHVAKRLLEDGHEVVGVDNLNDHYDFRLKQQRIEMLETHGDYKFYRWHMEDPGDCKRLFGLFKPEIVVHLAARPGVQGSSFRGYVQDNITAFSNVLEYSRLNNVKRFVYASSSSVAGNGPFDEGSSDPLSFYAATKLANEAMAKAYSETYGMQTVGLRYFTVYGPWGRPDMAVWKFTEAVLESVPVALFGASRDFTYIDDVVDGTMLAMETPLKTLFNVFNIGTGIETNVEDMLRLVEEAVGKSTKHNYEFLPRGESQHTRADLLKSWETLGYKPKTSLHKGIQKFVQWYTEEYADDSKTN